MTIAISIVGSLALASLIISLISVLLEEEGVAFFGLALGILLTTALFVLALAK